MTPRGSIFRPFRRQPPYSNDDPPEAPKISEAGSSLAKSRIGKAKEPLTCQQCEAGDAEQYECLCVLCGQCFKGHICGRHPHRA